MVCGRQTFLDDYKSLNEVHHRRWVLDRWSEMLQSDLQPSVDLWWFIRWIQYSIYVGILKYLGQCAPHLGEQIAALLHAGQSQRRQKKVEEGKMDSHGAPDIEIPHTERQWIANSAEMLARKGRRSFVRWY